MFIFTFTIILLSLIAGNMGGLSHMYTWAILCKSLSQQVIQFKSKIIMWSLIFVNFVWICFISETFTVIF